MPTQIIDGKSISSQIRNELKEDVKRLTDKGFQPGLAVILVGENPASQVYVGSKEKSCNELGIYSEAYRLPADASEEELLSLIDKLNKKKEIDGILVQLPLPEHINEEKVLLKIDPDKDVDGFHPINVGRMVIGNPRFLPCTPWGIQELLVRTNVDPSGKHVVVIGRSNIVGKPIACILVQKAKGANATVTICHSRTKNIEEIARQADILIAAIGQPKFVKADMVKDGAVVIDVGVNRIPDASKKSGTRLVGDVDFEAVKEKTSAITPVPGGVGPMTIAMLMMNTVKSAKHRAGEV
ncbi:MAG TPA: bifunctional methylenetetrahydrofolate dehydrogenase/methenyltetrahydrofolate cyclohydrolase FolD [Euryarchaeota archaeon]|nr:bifunctional methylenetetrahydrofolate dehydrogenase/methenyltetrahydrofolate cyclohydrolase FolD [Euryarchaeota archaeon]